MSQSSKQDVQTIIDRQEYILERRHPYHYQQRPTYWYDPDSGCMVFPDGIFIDDNAPYIGVFPLQSLLDGIMRNCEREYPRAKNVTLFLLAGRVMKNRPTRQWFNVSGDWTQEKLFWNRLQAEYVHSNGFKVYLHATGNFFGEERNLPAIYKEHYELEAMLEYKFRVEGYKVLGDTPAQTGRELLLVSLPHNRQYGRLPDNLAMLIYHNLRYQGRIETMTPQRPILDNGVYVIDGRWMYASCLSHLPVGEYLQDNVNRFASVRTKAGKLAPICPGFYHVTVTVPSNWHHIGLIKEQPQRYDDESIYPNEPGYTFSNWITAAELALLLDNPTGISWTVHINERILWPETNHITDPLATWIRNLRELRAQVEQELEKRPSLIGQLHKEAIRSIVLHTIGSFLQVVTLEHQFTPNSELPLSEEPYRGQFQRTPKGIYWNRARPLTGQRQRFIHPEWSATVYGRARAKLAEFALRLPYEDIVSLRTDSVWCASLPAWIDSEDTGKPGCFRTQDHVSGSWPWPKDSASMRSFVIKHHAAKRNNEALQQELAEREEEE